MNIIKITEEQFSMTAAMTKQLFEDESSNKALTTAEFETRLSDALQNGCEAFHFIEDNAIIGYALVNKARTPYYLIDFFICRENRRNQRGTTAFYTLLDTLDTKTIDLDVFCWNERGRGFWESLGFKELAVIMRKEEL